MMDVLQEKGKIDSVTVFTDRALVKRKIIVDHKKGETRLEVPGIPFAVDESSIQIKAQSSHGLVISNVNVSAVEHKAEVDKKMQELSSQLQEAKNEKAALEVEIEARKRQASFVDNLAKGRAEMAGMEAISGAGKVDVECLENLFNFIYEKKVESDKSALKLRERQDEVNKLIDKLNRQLSNKKQFFHRMTDRLVVADFKAAGEGRSVFHLEYIVPSASWAPEYTVRARDGNKSVLLSYSANVRQSSGEEWEDVKITLSTSSPKLGARAPRLEPWRMGFREQLGVAAPAGGAEITRGLAMEEFGADVLAAGALEDLEEAPVAAMARAAVSAREGQAVTFEVEKRDTISSGGGATKIPVAEPEFELEAEYMTIPRLSPYVYSRAKFTNSSGYPFLEGPTNVFVEENYLGKGRMLHTPPGKEIKLDLGVDEEIQVERKIVNVEERRAGLLSKKNTVRHVYEIKMTSFKAREQAVRVKDQLPLSTHQDLVLKDVALSPEPENRTETNILTWEIKLAPKEEKAIRMEFELESPAGKELWSSQDF